MHSLSEENILIFLLQVFILLSLSRGLGELFRTWKQPPLTAEILVGIFLGPTILGRIFPDVQMFLFPPDEIQRNMLETVGLTGVLLLLLETGLEIDFSSAWRQRGDALKIALADIVIPMAIAFVPFFFLPAQYLVNSEQRIIFAFFMATVMTISAIPVAARALHDLKLSKTDLGFLIMSALSVNDIIGWLLFTLVLGFFTQSTLDIPRVLIILSGTLGFTILCLTLGRNFANHVLSKIKERQMPQTSASLTFICLLGLICGVITQKLGIHALFGFFIAGIMAGGAKALSEKTRQVISEMVYAIFVPLFFANICLNMDFFRNFDFFLVVLVCVIGIGGRFLGAWIGVNLTKISKVNRLTIAIAHTPGGAMEIVIGVLALKYHLITETVFVAIVIGAILSSVVLGPWLNYSLKRRKEINFLEFFSSRSIVEDLKVGSRDAGIEKLCELASGHIDIPGFEEIISAVMARENELGTAIEEGIALPHARLKSLKKTVIVFGRSLSGIEWNAPDGQPTHFIFLILTSLDDLSEQAQILSVIAKSLSSEATRTRILQAKDTQGIWEIFQNEFKTKNIVKQ